MSPRQRQLSFRRTDPEGPASVQVELHEAGAWLRVAGLAAPYEAPEPTELRISVRGEPALEGAPEMFDRPPALTLADRASDRNEGQGSVDPLSRISWASCRSPDWREDPPLVSLVETVRRHLIRRCEPEARREAVRYSPWSHWFLYRRLVLDRSGRLLRASREHPGLVALACGVESYGWRWWAHTLFDGIEAGEAPAALVDAFVRWRVEADPKLYGLLEEWDWDPVEPWLESEPCSPIPLERAELQRRFLLRSGPELPVFLYAEPPPAGLPRSKLPRTRAERRRLRRLLDDLRGAGWSERTPTPQRFRRAAAWLASHPRAKVDPGKFGAWLAAGGRLTTRTRPSTVRRESAGLTPFMMGSDPE